MRYLTVSRIYRRSSRHAEQTKIGKSLSKGGFEEAIYETPTSSGMIPALAEGRCPTRVVAVVQFALRHATVGSYPPLLTFLNIYLLGGSGTNMLPISHTLLRTNKTPNTFPEGFRTVVCGHGITTSGKPRIRSVSSRKMEGLEGDNESAEGSPRALMGFSFSPTRFPTLNRCLIIWVVPGSLCGNSIIYRRRCSPSLPE